MKQSSFWETESFNASYNLIVIGAGIVGLSSALFYRQHQPDAHILVIDKGAIPEGASTRNAGFACVGSITEHVADMQKETEDNIKKRLQRRYSGLQQLRQTLGDEAIGYDNCGGYELFVSEDAFGEAREYIPLFNGWLNELVDEKEVYTPRELNGYKVIHNKLEGALHPGKMMHSLVKRVEDANIKLQWNIGAKEIEKTGSVLLENDRRFKTEQVLVASNGFTKRLLPDIPIKPARGFVMVSEPWPSNPWIGTFNHDRGYIYFRNLRDRLLLGGGRNIAMEEETLDQFGTNASVKSYLEDFARDTLGVPEDLSFEHEWSGIMGFTSSKTPVIKRLGDHCVVAAGLSGMGIAMGMDVGKRSAELLLSN